MAKQRTTEANPIETYFLWWANELKEQGFIADIRREPFSIELTPVKKSNRVSFKQKQAKIEPYTLFNKSTYKFDYVIIWADQAREYFYNILDENQPYRIWCPFYAQVDEIGNHVSLVDVKPPAAAMVYGNNTSGYTFPIIQKVLWHMYNLYVNKAIPIPMVSKGEIKSGNASSLFTTTFVPKRYLLTDSGMQARTIRYRFKSLQEYIQSRQIEIGKINSLLTVQTQMFNNKI